MSITLTLDQETQAELTKIGNQVNTIFQKMDQLTTQPPETPPEAPEQIKLPVHPLTKARASEWNTPTSHDDYANPDTFDSIVDKAQNHDIIRLADGWYKPDVIDFKDRYLTFWSASGKAIFPNSSWKRGHLRVYNITLQDYETRHQHEGMLEPGSDSLFVGVTLTNCNGRNLKLTPDTNNVEFTKGTLDSGGIYNFSMLESKNIRFYYNKMTNGNTRKENPKDAASNMKSVKCDGLIMFQNEIMDNHGCGVWTDNQNHNIIIMQNTIGSRYPVGHALNRTTHAALKFELSGTNQWSIRNTFINQNEWALNYSDTENCTSIEDQFINNQMAINIDSNKRWLDWYEKNLITGPLRIIQPTIHQQIHRSNNKSGIYRRYQPYVENTNIEIINPVVIMPEGTQARNQGETRTPKTKTIVLNMESLKALPEMQNLQIMTPNI